MLFSLCNCIFICTCDSCEFTPRCVHVCASMRVTSLRVRCSCISFGRMGITRKSRSRIRNVHTSVIPASSNLSRHTPSTIDWIAAAMSISMYVHRVYSTFNTKSFTIRSLYANRCKTNYTYTQTEPCIEDECIVKLVQMQR